MSEFRGENPALGQVSVDGVSSNLVKLPASGAIPANKSADYVITKATAAALTLAKPTQDGLNITVASSTGAAHTITATGLLQTGSASVNVATMAASAGASVSLQSFNGKWMTLGQIGVTFS